MGHIPSRMQALMTVWQPQYAIESIARRILPDILAYYESEEGQRESQEWKARREAEQT